MLVHTERRAVNLTGWHLREQMNNEPDHADKSTPGDFEKYFKKKGGLLCRQQLNTATVKASAGNLFSADWPRVPDFRKSSSKDH